MLGGILGLGLGPVPQFGMRGVAAGSLTAYSIGGAIMAWYHVFRPGAGHSPVVRGLRIRRGMFFDILKVGAVSCFSPLQSVLTITILTHMLAQFGTQVLAGYGIGARLEFMLTSIAFAVGIASVPMVGMAIGAERVARARRIALIAGCVSFVSVGLVGSVIAIFPDLWVDIFTHDRGVRAASRQYLSIAAPMYAFLGLVDLDVFFLARRCESPGTGARAKRPAVVRGWRRLVAVDERCDRREILRAGRGFDGGARRAVGRRAWF